MPRLFNRRLNQHQISHERLTEALNLLVALRLAILLRCRVGQSQLSTALRTKLTLRGASLIEAVILLLWNLK